jgi:hypothetical protein
MIRLMMMASHKNSSLRNTNTDGLMVMVPSNFVLFEQWNKEHRTTPLMNQKNKTKIGRR